MYQVDVSTCPVCGHRMRLMETATTPDAVARRLARQGLAPRPPPPAPAPSAQLGFAFMKKA